MDQARFRFESYNILDFSFNSSNYGGEDDISLKIDPTGVFYVKERKYLLEIQFCAFRKENSIENSFVSCRLQAEYIFSEQVTNLEDVPAYFYANSIAIVFPYLRAFISSLTIQANLKPLILPTMNLTSLSNPLREHTTIVV